MKMPQSYGSATHIYLLFFFLTGLCDLPVPLAFCLSPESCLKIWFLLQHNSPFGAVLKLVFLLSFSDQLDGGILLK